MHLFRSIRVRLTLWYVLLLALILAAFSAGIYVMLRGSLYSNLDDTLEARSEELRPTVALDASGLTIGGVPEGDSTADDQFVRLFDASGSVTFASHEASIDRDAVEAALAGETVTVGVDAGGDTFRSLVAPVILDDEVVGVLEVARSEDDVTDTLSTLVLILSISYPVTLAVATLAGVFLAGRALAPIDELTRVARRISAEDLSQRLDLALPDDEVGRLARTFDDMLARLDLAFRQQRQFTADASHELRTPLTVIKGNVEVALGEDRDGAAYREVLTAVNDEVDRLIRLVASLLTMARADAGQIALARERVDVADLVAGAVDHVRPLAADRGIELDVTQGAAAALQAEEDLLLQLLLNLLDNAVKYTPSGGRVATGWDATDTNVALWVRDSGPGIATEQLPRIFDRFYRVDMARGRAEGGVGLGLSICKWIAEAHGGTIAATSAPGEGSTFTVSLPREAPGI